MITSRYNKGLQIIYIYIKYHKKRNRTNQNLDVSTNQTINSAAKPPEHSILSLSIGIIVVTIMDMQQFFAIVSFTEKYGSQLYSLTPSNHSSDFVF